MSTGRVRTKKKACSSDQSPDNLPLRSSGRQVFIIIYNHVGLYSAIFYFLLTFIKKTGFIVYKLGLRVLFQKEGELINCVNK